MTELECGTKIYAVLTIRQPHVCGVRHPKLGMKIFIIPKIENRTRPITGISIINRMQPVIVPIKSTIADRISVTPTCTQPEPHPTMERNTIIARRPSKRKYSVSLNARRTRNWERPHRGTSIPGYTATASVHTANRAELIYDTRTRKRPTGP